MNTTSTMHPIQSVKEIKVIETVSVIGEGTQENPVRQLYQYWDSDGKLLAEHDTLNDTKEKE